MKKAAFFRRNRVKIIVNQNGVQSRQNEISIAPRKNRKLCFSESSGIKIH